MSGQWCMLLVKSRMEKKLRTIMQRLHVWHYVPMYTRTRKVQRRIVRTELPLFPRYVLARFDNAEKRVQVLRTNVIVSTIPLPAPRPVIHQLRHIARAIRHERDVRAVPIAWNTGETVRVAQGPLQGMEGCATRMGGGKSLVIGMGAFGGAAAVSLSPENRVLPKERTPV
ncbi:MAG: transcription termination/antitermination protein NusG [Kiritimatiellia bacterium]